MVGLPLALVEVAATRLAGETSFMHGCTPVCVIKLEIKKGFTPARVVMRDRQSWRVGKIRKGFTPARVVMRDRQSWRVGKIKKGFTPARVVMRDRQSWRVG